MSARTLTQATSNSCLLRVERISKQFPGVQALSGVSFSLRSQEVLGIVGENGAGKSTLMKILAGAQTPDSGEIYLGERPVKLHTSRQAIQQGIVLIHQELNLCGNLNVAQNIFLGREPRWGPWIKRRQMLRDATRHLKAVGLSISPVTPTDRLTVGRQQMVEIAKALAVDARVIIFDEPTSSLSQRETESLFGLIDELRQRGCGLIYISHRLEEICRLADPVLVLRDGYRVGELHGKEIQHDAMVRMMVGRDVAQRFSRREHALGDEALAVEGLVTTAFPQQAVSFSVRAGEIVGVAGLVGAGRSELLQAIFGVDPPLAGQIRVAGMRRNIRSPQQAINAGMGLVPEDRQRHGLILDANLRKNVGLPGLSRFARWLGWVNFGREARDARAAIKQLQIKTDSDQRLVKFLSGGNQQKVVIGKWLALSPRVLLLDEPTRGIDVGAKQEIYRLMEELASQGLAILFVSSELDEIMGLADRALVMHEGAVSGELARHEFTEERFMQLATGSTGVAH